LSQEVAHEGHATRCNCRTWTPFGVAGRCRSFLEDGRGGEIRTHDLYVPDVALYQAKLRPDIVSAAFSTVGRRRKSYRTGHRKQNRREITFGQKKTPRNIPGRDKGGASALRRRGRRGRQPGQVAVLRLAGDEVDGALNLELGRAAGDLGGLDLLRDVEAV